MIAENVWHRLKKIGIASIARDMGITKANIYRWRNSTPVPDGRLLELEKVTGVPSHLFKTGLFDRYTRW